MLQGGNIFSRKVNVRTKCSPDFTYVKKASYSFFWDGLKSLMTYTKCRGNVFLSHLLAMGITSKRHIISMQRIALWEIIITSTATWISKIRGTLLRNVDHFWLLLAWLFSYQCLITGFLRFTINRLNLTDRKFDMCYFLFFAECKFKPKNTAHMKFTFE